MTLEQAHEKLNVEYERAKKLEYIRNPLAYALHKVWRIADLKQPSGRPKKERD